MMLASVNGTAPPCCPPGDGVMSFDGGADDSAEEDVDVDGRSIVGVGGL